MHTRHALFVIAGIATLFTAGITGIAQATPAPAPAPRPPTTPTYICDKIIAVPPGIFGYNNCQGYGAVTQSTWILNNHPYTMIPRTGDIQRYRCSGGSADLPMSIAPASCTPEGPAIPAAQAPRPVPYSGPPSGWQPY
jgi:hypothetical protein